MKKRESTSSSSSYESDSGSKGSHQDEPEMEPPQTEVRNRRSKKKKSTKRRTSSSASSSSQPKEKADQATAYMKTAFAIALVVYVVFDISVAGFQAGSTFFVDWWDMIGTIAYLKSRGSQYSLRKRANQKVGWVVFIVLDAFVLYVIAGKICRTIMRGTPQVPSMVGLLDFIVYGIVPLHFFPRDYLYELVQNDDIHQLIICLFWGLTKVRSLHSQIREAVYVHHYDFPRAFLLCLLSCEIASIISRVDKNVTKFPLTECLKRFPGGVKTGLVSKTFASSVIISVLMFVTIKSIHIPVVWVFPYVLTFFACFYRYANGLFERVVAEKLNLSEPSSFREYEHQLQQFVENLNADTLQSSLQTVPEKFVGESLKLTESLIISLDKLNTESKAELRNFMTYLEEYSKKEVGKAKSKAD